MVSATELSRVGDIRDRVDPDVLQSLPVTANKHSTSAAELAVLLTGFLERKEQNLLSLSELGSFEQYIIHTEKEKRAQRVPLKDATPDASKGKRSGNFDTPGENKSMKVEEDSDKPTVSTAAAVTPAASTKKVTTVPFAERKGRNEMTKEVNPDLGVRGDYEPSESKPIGLRCKIGLNDEDFFNVPLRYRYMFTPPDERAFNLDKHTVAMQDYMIKKAQIDPDEVVPVGLPSPDEVWCCGRIVCQEMMGKMTKQAVALEGSHADSQGRRVDLKLDDIVSLALFPGQIVMVQGICANGKEMAVKRIIEGVPEERPSTSPKQLLEYHHSTRHQGGKALSIMTAAGPFTEATNLDFAPLMDLLAKLLRQKPDVLILMGPFVDGTQQCLADGDMELNEEDEQGNVVGKHTASYDMVFIEKVIRDGINAIYSAVEEDGEELPTHIVMVPSLNDAHHECVYPQPPYGAREEKFQIQTPYFNEKLGAMKVKNGDDSVPSKPKRVHLLPNPCMFRVNEVLFGVTTNDILFNLTQDKVMEKVGAPIERNAAHLLQQHSFCPQFPSPEKALAQLDLRHMKHWTMKKSPDVLLLPSKLGTNGYIANVLETLVVNPGTLVRGATAGGTYSELHIHPIKEEELRDQITASAAGGDAEPIKHDVCKRSHVKIIKI